MVEKIEKQGNKRKIPLVFLDAKSDMEKKYLHFFRLIQHTSWVQCTFLAFKIPKISGRMVQEWSKS